MEGAAASRTVALGVEVMAVEVMAVEVMAVEVMAGTDIPASTPLTIRLTSGCGGRSRALLVGFADLARPFD